MNIFNPLALWSLTRALRLALAAAGGAVLGAIVGGLLTLGCFTKTALIFFVFCVVTGSTLALVEAQRHGMEPLPIQGFAGLIFGFVFGLLGLSGWPWLHGWDALLLGSIAGALIFFLARWTKVVFGLWILGVLIFDLDEALASGRKSGYQFQMRAFGFECPRAAVIQPGDDCFRRSVDCRPGPDGRCRVHGELGGYQCWTAEAHPLEYLRTGVRSFYIDLAGTLRAANVEGTPGTARMPED